MRGGEFFGALRERQFRLLWLGQATSTLGDGLVPVAVPPAQWHAGRATPPPRSPIFAA